MTITEMLGQSGILTVLGMGIVFAFLAIMIFIISSLGKVIHRLGMDTDVSPPVPARTASAGGINAAGSGAVDKGAVTAAITAAVSEYRKTNN